MKQTLGGVQSQGAQLAGVRMSGVSCKRVRMGVQSSMRWCWPRQALQMGSHLLTRSTATQAWFRVEGHLLYACLLLNSVNGKLSPF